jgi:hypothetical protein
MTKLKDKLIVALSAAGSVLLVGAAPGFSDATYELVIIEPWNTSYSLATSGVAGLNNLNQVTGCATTEPLGGPCMFLWTYEDGKAPINLAGPINDLGVIVSTDTIRWPDGTLQQLDGAMHGAADLNNANVVVGADGSLHTCEYPPYFPDREATVWTESGGTVLVQQQLGVPAADQAWAINDNNEFVGVRSSTGMCGDQKAFYFNLVTGEHIDLHFELVGGTSGITHAVDINDAGMVIGDGPVYIGGGAFLWSAAAGFAFFPDLPGTLPGYSIPSSINNAGTVVGQAIVNEEWRAWIWDEQSGIRDLNELAQGVPADFVVEQAIAINDNGWIIARGHYGTWSPERAVVLIPISMPVPGDLDGDGDVDLTDLSLLLAAFGSCSGDPNYNADADLDGSGCVELVDLSTLLANFGA